MPPPSAPGRVAPAPPWPPGRLRKLFTWPCVGRSNDDGRFAPAPPNEGSCDAPGESEGRAVVCGVPPVFGRAPLKAASNEPRAGAAEPADPKFPPEYPPKFDGIDGRLIDGAARLIDGLRLIDGAGIGRAMPPP